MAIIPPSQAIPEPQQEFAPRAPLPLSRYTRLSRGWCADRIPALQLLRELADFLPAPCCNQFVASLSAVTTAI